jgi:hypothetical protein
MSPITSESNRIDRHLRADTNTIDQLSVIRASFYADVYFTLALDTYCGPTTKHEKTGYESPREVSTSIQSLRWPFVSVAVLTFEKCAERTLLFSTAVGLALRTTIYSRIVRLIPEGPRRLRPFSSKRFHALLNSLFKVLFNFPSRYLFAIGLVVIFSFRRGLPSALGYTLK